MALTASWLSQILFLNLSGFEEIFTLCAFFKTAKLALLYLVWLCFLFEIAASTDVEDFSALLLTTAKATEYRLKALTFLSFDFNIRHSFSLLSEMGRMIAEETKPSKYQNCI